MLPGPPRELRPMFTDSVVPLLRRVLPLAGEFVCRTLRTTGIGESMVQEKIGAPAASAWSRPGSTWAIARGPGRWMCASRLAGLRRSSGCARRRQSFGSCSAPHIYGVEDEELEAVIVRLLTERKATLALAESCTGGCIAHRRDECARRLGGAAGGPGHLQQRRQAEVPRRAAPTRWPGTARSAKPWRAKWPKARAGRRRRTTRCR